jgi:Helix-turn-helix domain
MRRGGVSNKILERVFWYSRARGADRLVLLVLADRADDDGCCYPGIDYIAARAAVNRATVFRSLPRLVEQLGELRRDPGGTGRGETNRYTVTVGADGNTPERVSGCDPSAHAKGSHPGTKGSHPRSERVAGCDPIPQDPNEPSPARARSRAPARRRSVGRTEPTPDPRIRSLLDAFCERHAETLGQPYRVCGGRDGKHLKDALKLYDEPTIRRTLDAYFADRAARLRFGASVPQFVAGIATLAARTPVRPPVRNFTAERFAEEEAAERAAAAQTAAGDAGTREDG